MDPNNFSKTTAAKENIQQIMKSTKLVKNDDLDQVFPIVQGVSVAVRLKSGKILKNQVMHAKGRPKNEMSFKEVCDKFTTLTRDTFPPEYKDNIIGTVKNLEEISDISKLTELLVHGRA
jgi:2-methylcitrate dehydratase